MKRILVTGAGGFIGSHLMDYLSEKYPTDFVYALYHNLPFSEPNLAKAIMLVGDITNYSRMKQIIAEYEITHVFHLAAQPIVSIAEKSPISTLQTNIIGTTVLLELCREFKFTLIYQSTDKVFGHIENADYDSLHNPVDLYGISKSAADQLCEFYKYRYYLDIRIIRPCNIFGFDKNLSRLIPDLITTCLKGINPQINAPDLFAGKEKFMKRQFMYVKNFVMTLVEAAFLGPPIYHIFHIATNNILTTKEVALAILKYFPTLTLEYKRFLSKPIEIGDQYLNMDHCFNSEETKLTPFKEAIEQTIEEYRRWLKL